MIFKAKKIKENIQSQNLTKTCELFLLAQNNHQKYIFQKLNKRIIKKIITKSYLSCRYCDKIFQIDKKIKKNANLKEN